ncbi:MAG: hypothetical protein DI556_06500 [Rhodovulum sulfidophilum]|uniref:ATP-grasp domain-containing protein n=1 Tax=Rhodovulum sulfidophilum TaxID=35806 RepID=A0A2W5Q7T0_RHOSU|nr:MAG: hypothetical protein DI556_06500 [Rhodovulum sulfidophilum]
MMLAFIATDDHQYTFRDILETRAHPFHGGVLFLSHADFLSWPRLPVADYVFVDLERLPLPELGAAAARFAALGRVLPEVRALNRPTPALTRIGVMRRLHDSGINDFRVLTAREALALADQGAGPRFPVFVRRLDDHDGPMSALIADAAALRAAIAIAGAAGAPAETLAVTEYIDARNADGLHEKLSYFRLGARLFPSARDVSRNWVCKGLLEDPDTVSEPDRERAFLAGNPHAEELGRAFAAAGIDYGRADYAMVDGRARIFEINTNPLLDDPATLPPALQTYARLLIDRWLDALAAFSAPAPGPVRWVAVPGAAAPAPRAGRHRLRRAVRGLLATVGGLQQETRVARALRAAGIGR